MKLSKRFCYLLCFFAHAFLFAADDPQPEPGEHALSAAESAQALHAMAETFKAHPTVRGKIRSEIEDLAGKRVEEGELLLDRGADRASRVLRVFKQPKPKAWLLNGSTISEYVPLQKKVFVKDLSGAPKAIKQIQAAMTGDVQALDSIFAIRIFSKPNANAPTAWRLVFDKKPGVSKLIHRRIEARINEGGLFFSEIHYIPDEGDELTETFFELKDAGVLSETDFTLPGAEGVERKVETITE